MHRYSRVNRKNLDDEIGEWTKNYTKYEVMEKLQAAGIPSMPSLSNLDLLKDEHVKHRNIFQEMDYSGRATHGMPYQDEVRAACRFRYSSNIFSES